MCSVHDVYITDPLHEVARQYTGLTAWISAVVVVLYI